MLMFSGYISGEFNIFGEKILIVDKIQNICYPLRYGKKMNR